MRNEERVTRPISLTLGVEIIEALEAEAGRRRSNRSQVAREIIGRALLASESGVKVTTLRGVVGTSEGRQA